jgi:hypothetical protein
LARRELRSLVEQARRTLVEALDNPSTSAGHREELRKPSESLEILLIRSKLDRIKALTTPR